MAKFQIGSDTYIDKTHIGAANAGAGRVVLNNGTNTKYGLFHVGIPELSGSIVHDATLHVFLKGGDWSSGNVIKVDLLVSHKWSEKTTWHSYHTYATADVDSAHQGSHTLTGHVDGTEVQIDISAILQDAAGEDHFGLLLSVSTNADRSLYSSEAQHKAYRPYITMTYDRPPDPPTNLHPNTGASASKPKLAWDSSVQEQFQVQLSSNGSTVADDSGWQVTEFTQVDTADTSLFAVFAGIADAASYYWRVRVRNAAGATSDWTSWTQWTRHVLSALAITLPAIDGDTVVTTTPEFDWTFGGTETAWQLEIPDVGYDSTETPGTDLVFEIPSGTLEDRNTVYTAVLRVWDDFTRDAPSDHDFVLVERTFVYNGSNAEAGVTGLTLATDGPAQVLTWHRGGPPDAFTIFADDEIIVDQIDWSDVFVSGTTYSYRLLRVGRSPVTAVAFDVEAHDNALGDSHNSGTVEGLTGPTGIWLVRETASGLNSIEVRIEGQDSIQMKLTEDGATFMPLGSRSPVRVVDQIRGYEGSVQGLIFGDDALADFQSLKAIAPGTKTNGTNGTSVLRLIFGQQNIPVDIGQVTVQQIPYSEGENAFNVSFEFWQTDAPWPVT
jgi:hypothetical protein